MLLFSIYVWTVEVAYCTFPIMTGKCCVWVCVRLSFSVLGKIKAKHWEVAMEERRGRSEIGGKLLFGQPRQVGPTVRHEQARGRGTAAPRTVPHPRQPHPRQTTLHISCYPYSRMEFVLFWLLLYRSYYGFHGIESIIMETRTDSAPPSWWTQ